MDEVINGISKETTGLDLQAVMGRLGEKNSTLAKNTAKTVYRAATTVQQAEERMKATFATIRIRMTAAEQAMATTGILNHYGIISEQSTSIDIDAERYTQALHHLADALDVAVEVLALK